MYLYTKLLMTALTAALVLSIGASTSAASRSLSIEGETRLTLNGPVTFEATVGGRVGRIICNTTFTKTISRVIPKIEGTLIGRVTDVTVEDPRTCRVENIERLNTVIILGLRPEQELWRIFYQRFLGALPEISGILFTLRRVQVLLDFRAGGVEFECLYENGGRPESVGILARVERRTIGRLNTLNRLEEETTREFALVADLEPFRVSCPRRARFRAEVTPLQTTRIVLL